MGGLSLRKAMHMLRVLHVPYRLTYRQGCWAVPGDAQNAFELPVNGAKELSLIWQLALNVWSYEDVLQVQPLLLAL